MDPTLIVGSLSLYGTALAAGRFLDHHARLGPGRSSALRCPRPGRAREIESWIGERRGDPESDVAAYRQLRLRAAARDRDSCGARPIAGRRAPPRAVRARRGRSRGPGGSGRLPGRLGEGAGAHVVGSAASMPARAAALERLLESDRRKKVNDTVLPAIAYHDDAQADTLIERRALDRSLTSDERQQAVFWAGQARGERGLRLLERVLTSEPSVDLREHAVFAMSQSSVPTAAERIKARRGRGSRPRSPRSRLLLSLADAGRWRGGLDRRPARRGAGRSRARASGLCTVADPRRHGTGCINVLRSKRDPGWSAARCSGSASRTTLGARGDREITVQRGSSRTSPCD